MAHTLNYVVDSGPDSFKHTRDAGAELDAPMIKEREDSVSYTEGNQTIFSQFFKSVQVRIVIA